MAVDCFLCDGERWHHASHGRNDLIHHVAAVLKRIVLRPSHCCHVVVKVFSVLWKVRKVVVRQLDKELLHLALGLGDVVRANHVADAA